MTRKEEQLRSYGPWAIRRCDVYVVSFSPGLIDLRLEIVRDLWRNGIKADLVRAAARPRQREADPASTLRRCTTTTSSRSRLNSSSAHVAAKVSSGSSSSSLAPLAGQCRTSRKSRSKSRACFAGPRTKVRSCLLNSCVPALDMLRPQSLARSFRAGSSRNCANSQSQTKLLEAAQRMPPSRRLDRRSPSHPSRSKTTFRSFQKTTCDRKADTTSAP